MPITCSNEIFMFLQPLVSAEAAAEFQEEIDHLEERVQYFKKLLADTELKLSDAYKEISDLRMERDEKQARSVRKNIYSY